MKFKVGNQEFEIKDAELTKALADGATLLGLADDVTVRTKSEDDAYIENHKKAARVEGVEIAVKKARETMGLEFEGKSIENLISASTKKAVEEAKIDPDKKVSKLTEQLEEKNTAVKQAIKRAEDAELSIKQLKSSSRIEKIIDEHMPKNTLLPSEDIKTILRSKLSIKENDEGGLEVYDSNGTLLKNKSTADPLPVKDAIEDFFRTNVHYTKPVEGGAGGGNSGGASGKLTVEKFNESMNAKGFAINSPEYDAELSKHIADKSIEL